MIRSWGTLVCVQPNGEQLRLEAWVYRDYLYGRLDDPLLRAPIVNAVRMYWW